MNSNTAMPDVAAQEPVETPDTYDVIVPGAGPVGENVADMVVRGGLNKSQARAVGAAICARAAGLPGDTAQAWGRYSATADQAAVPQVVVGVTFVRPDVSDLLHGATDAGVGEVPLSRPWHAVPLLSHRLGDLVEAARGVRRRERRPAGRAAAVTTPSGLPAPDEVHRRVGVRLPVPGACRGTRS